MRPSSLGWQPGRPGSKPSKLPLLRGLHAGFGGEDHLVPTTRNRLAKDLFRSALIKYAGSLGEVDPFVKTSFDHLKCSELVGLVPNVIVPSAILENFKAGSSERTEFHTALGANLSGFLASVGTIT